MTPAAPWPGTLSKPGMGRSSPSGNLVAPGRGAASCRFSCSKTRPARRAPSPERGRRVRHGALPQERDGTLAVRVVPSRMVETAAGGGPALASLLEAALGGGRVSRASCAPDDPRFFNPTSRSLELPGPPCARPARRHHTTPVLLAKVFRRLAPRLALRFAGGWKRLEALTGRPVPGGIRGGRRRAATIT